MKNTIQKVFIIKGTYAGKFGWIIGINKTKKKFLIKTEFGKTIPMPYNYVGK